MSKPDSISYLNPVQGLGLRVLDCTRSNLRWNMHPKNSTYVTKELQAWIVPHWQGDSLNLHVGGLWKSRNPRHQEIHSMIERGIPCWKALLKYPPI